MQLGKVGNGIKVNLKAYQVMSSSSSYRLDNNIKVEPITVYIKTEEEEPITVYIKTEEEEPITVYINTAA